MTDKKTVKIGKRNAELASAGSRFGAYLLDSVFLGLLMLPIYVFYFAGLVAAKENLRALLFVVLIFITLSFSISISYYVLTLSGKKQSTWGMRVLDLRAVRTDGSDLTRGRAFVRWLGMIVNNLGLYLGWLWVVIDENRQGWHDKMADVYVIKQGRK